MATPATTLDVDGREVRLSSPDKVYFPALGLTKRDLADYVLSVGPGVLAGVRDRPTTMERWPGGVDGDESFYQKRLPKAVPEWVGRSTITFPSGRKAETVCPQDLATVLWMLNLGTLRFHPWPVRGGATDLVDELRLDLDPQPGTGFADAVEAALALREILAELGLTGFCKTSGGRGVHVFARVEPTHFIDARHAAIAIGRELARRLPDLVTVNWWKEERGERIFVDFNQMARDRLMTSAYSIRPVEKALVSTPLTWDELPDADPEDFTVPSVPKRFAEVGDPWAGLADAEPASLAPALAWYDRDAESGEGEMPYPPDYPKMPGEPPRVQPSRAKRDG
ncbi:DNA polymerase domain-containing protein [Nigerium massiliense]|uniref:DNA polymerase domain-containing protein n=1 Tax=Nigerium massiliense TaxID=1522317 RepID=UPI00058C9048|nr:DNA primase small subunit domain-containing protein [Nigerium massiliense]